MKPRLPGKTLARVLEKRLMLDAAAVNAIAGAINYFDAQDIDGDGNTGNQPANGTAVSNWDDISPNDFDSDQTTGGNQPLFDTSALNGRGGIRFDGINDISIIANDAQINTGSYTEKSFAFVFETGADVNGVQIIYEQGGSSNGYQLSIVNGHLYAYTWAESYWAGGDRYKSIDLGAVSANTSYRAVMIHDATDPNINNKTWSAGLNGGALQTLTRVDTMGAHSGNNALGGVGDSSQHPVTDADLATGSYFKGAIGEFRAWNHVLTAGEQADIETYLYQKWFGTLALTTNNGTTLNEGASIVITTGELDATDTDTPDSNLIYTITSATGNGTLFNGTTALGLTGSFTQQDIIDGRISYTHDDSETDTDSFSFSLTDGGEIVTGSFNMTINAVFDPAANINTGASLDEGGSTVIQNTQLSYDGTGGDTTTWYDTNWLYRQKLTIDSTQIDSDLTDFSVLFTEAGLNGSFWSNVQTNGADIVITAADGTTKLDRELVSLDTVGKTMQLYARTNLSSTIDTDVYIYFGNAAAAETNQATTWRNEFTGVWHFDSDFDVSVADSSQSANTGFTRAGFNSGNQIAGVTGQAGQFNNSEYLALNYAYSGNNTLPQVSVSAWINTTESGGNWNDNWALIDFDRSEFFDVFINTDGTVGFSTAGNGLSVHDFYSAATVNDGTWHHIAAVYDGTDKILYVDGVESARSTNTHGGLALGKNTRYGFIGDGSEASTFDTARNSLYYDGAFDDMRLYEGTMSNAWVAAEYRNANDPSAFYAGGNIQMQDSQLVYTVDVLPDNGVIALNGIALNVNDTFLQDDIDNGRITYIHDDSETTSDSFEFTVGESAGLGATGQIFLFNIRPVSEFSTPDDPSDAHAEHETPHKNGPKEMRTSPQLIRSTFSGEGQSAFYGGALNEIVREGATAQIRQTLEEMDGESGGELPNGTPHILSALEKEFFPAQDHPLRQFLQDAAPEENGDMPEEEGTPLSGQTDGALLLEQGRFDRNVLNFLRDIT
ncbi:MAG: hypothetical protein H6853_04000 [Rhodospirillales bacterium]|nr:MAG: hypothetical protein H6853_04000 [Rhodospirillales bacterium]